MRCRSYPKTTKPSITTPSTPSFTRKMTANSLARMLLTNSYYPQTSPRMTLRMVLRMSPQIFSILFGFLGPLSFFLGGWLIVQGFGENGTQAVIFSPLLSILGLCLGIAARRHGARAIGGLVLNGLGICFFLCIAFLIMLIANALSNMSNMH